MSDDTYLVEIVRTTLDEFQNRVENEEVGASEFVNNQVSPLDNQITNLATFKVLSVGQIPASPVFVRLEDLPAGKVSTWTGVVLLDGRNVAVSMYR